MSRLRRPRLWFLATVTGAIAFAGSVVVATRRAPPEDLPPLATGTFAAPVDAFPMPPPPALPSRLSPKEREDLRALGYSEGGVIGGVVGGVPGGVVGGMVGGLPDEPVPGMLFEARGANGFKRPDQDPLTTFGLDVDTASYTLVRNYLRRGQTPPPEAVRVEEFVNALPQDYAPSSEETFAIHVEGAPSPFHPGWHLLRIGLRAKDVSPADRKPAVLTFVIDVSGSMGMENRLGLVKRSLRLLLDKLGDSDRIGIVVYGTSGRVLVEPTQASNKRAILEAIESLEPEGTTNLENGLDLGYRLASQAFDGGANNRVILCTDGVANNGVTDARTLLQRIKHHADGGIDMMAVGFGMGNYNDALLQKLADEGNGQYAYIDDFREARNFFLRNLTGLLEVVARDAKAQVEFDPSRVEEYRLLGYEKRLIAHEDFRNDSVDGGEVNAGQTVTVLYEVQLRPTAGALGEARVRYLDPETRGPKEISREIDEESLRLRFEDASSRFRLTVLMARFAEHLRKSPWVQEERLEQVLEQAEGLPFDLRTPDVSELVELLKTTLCLPVAKPQG